jgi:hypothetical protein
LRGSTICGSRESSKIFDDSNVFSILDPAAVFSDMSSNQAPVATNQAFFEALRPKSLCELVSGGSLLSSRVRSSRGERRMRPETHQKAENIRSARVGTTANRRQGRPTRGRVRTIRLRRCRINFGLTRVNQNRRQRVLSVGYQRIHRPWDLGQGNE